MPKFQKVVTVDARKYEGPVLTVVNDQSGEQVATSGDYLVGTERGGITVIDGAVFEGEYAPFSETAEDEALAVAQIELAAIRKELDDKKDAILLAGNENATLLARNVALEAAQEDATKLNAQIAYLGVELDGEKIKNTDMQSRLDKIEALQKQESDAQATTDAAHAALLNTLTH